MRWREEAFPYRFLMIFFFFELKSVYSASFEDTDISAALVATDRQNDSYVSLIFNKRPRFYASSHYTRDNRSASMYPHTHTDVRVT